MGLKEKLRARRKRREDPYTSEELRLRKLIAEMDPFDERYDQLQGKLKNNISMQSDSKEAKSRLTKADKGSLLCKILSVGGAIGGVLLIGKYERDGNTYTGEKRSMMDAIARTFGQVFMHH